VWDGDHIIAEVDSMASTRFAEYVYRPGIDRPHALLSDSGSTTIARFFHQDELGNVIGLTRGTSLAQTLSYEPWGLLVDSTGALADTSRLRWKGLYWEGGNTRLYHVRNRWYDPEARRFTSEDPIGIEGGLNPYIFAGNDPVNGSDPFGLRPCDEMDGDHWDETLVKGFTWNWDVDFHTCPGVSGSGRGATLGPANGDGSGGGGTGGGSGPARNSSGVLVTRACAQAGLEFLFTAAGDAAFFTGLGAAGTWAVRGFRQARTAAWFAASARYARTNRGAVELARAQVAGQLGRITASGALRSYYSLESLSIAAMLEGSLSLGRSLPGFATYFAVREATAECLG
jgi:RHS repeat-associated protein